jgi:hypothetical protein
MAVGIDTARRDETAGRVDLAPACGQSRANRRNAPVSYAKVGTVTVGGGGDIGVAHHQIKCFGHASSVNRRPQERIRRVSAPARRRACQTTVATLS